MPDQIIYVYQAIVRYADDEDEQPDALYEDALFESVLYATYELANAHLDALTADDWPDDVVFMVIRSAVHTAALPVAA